MKQFLILLPFISLPAFSAPPSCVPGIYGSQYPASIAVPYVQGTAGAYSYWWCMNRRNAPVLSYMVCAAGSCPSAATLLSTLSSVTAAAVTQGPSAAYQAWFSASPQTFSCFSGPGSGPLPAAGSPQAAACSELATMVNRDRPSSFSPVTPNQ